MPEKNIFEKYLKEGETILWLGQPKPGLQVRDADIILIPISIILIGFSFALDYAMTQFEAPFIFKVAGVLFALTGIYVGSIRLLLDRSRRKWIFYCITDRRVLVVS